MTNSDAAAPGRANIDRLLEAIFPTLALVAGHELDVFTMLADGPKTAEDLAGALDVNALKLESLLYGLVMAELLTVTDGRFANTAEADYYLVRGRPAYAGLAVAHSADRWTRHLKTADSIRTGVPQGKLDFANMPDPELTTFYDKEHPDAVATGRLLAGSFDLCRFEHLLDVAGGSGGLAIGACQGCPNLRATVIDLPTVTPITQRFVDEADMSGRVEVSTLDAVASAPEGGYDVAVLRNIVQVVGPEMSRRLLANVANALVPGGCAFIIGEVLDDSHLSPPQIAAANYAFVNIYDEGRAFTEANHRAWLAEAGFTTFERTLLPSGESIIRSEKSVG
jgi:hypothetical protein